MICTNFHTGSLTHLTTLAVIAAVTGLLVITVRRRVAGPETFLRTLIGWGCIGAWVLNTGYWMLPERFELSQSLPLQFCNLANIFGALAILKGSRIFQSVLYFWSALCAWAFLTPTTCFLQLVFLWPGAWLIMFHYLRISSFCRQLLSESGSTY